MMSGAVITAVFIFFFWSRYSEEEKKGGASVPDVVSSRQLGDECRLGVVANGSRTDDRMSFAERVVEMYKDNAFYTIRFSRDSGESPEKVYMDVYPEKEDVGNGEPEFQIIYDAQSGKIDVK